MYASFFGLKELPFNNSPDPRFFFSTPDHEEALASLIYAVTEQKGFVLLTGEVGSGKTLVTRLMLKHFGNSIAFASITNTHVTPNELLHNICAEFDIEVHPSASNAEITRRLQDFLVTSFARNKPVVLMLDEAQALSRKAFEQVRMIGNLEADDAKLLQIVIVGQPELRQRFEANDMRQLRQRIFRSFHLPALNREQTQGYIHHRLGVAGARNVGDTFDDDAIDVIYGYSQGLPRLINTVCDNAMLSAYASDRRLISGVEVRRVICQMMSIAQGGPRFASPPVAPRCATAPEQVATAAGPVPAVAGASMGTTVAQATHPADRTRQPGYNPPAAHNPPARYNPPAAEPSAVLLEAVATARAMIDELSSVRRDLHETVRSARTTRGQADQATRRLAEQASRVGRLAVTIRNTMNRTPGTVASPVSRPERSCKSTQATRTQRLSAGARVRDWDRKVRENRRTLEDVRRLIASTAATACPTGEPVDTSEPSRLARQVRELSEMIERQTV